MTWLLLSAVGVLLSFGAIWLIGAWLLHREGYRYLGVPSQYDGKEPYAQWAEGMERARRIQEREDDPFDG